MLLLAGLIGVVAGLRTFTAPAAVAWATLMHWINMDGTWASWLGHPLTVTLLTILAVLEFVGDKLPNTPSRTVPLQFAARLITGAFAGAVIGTAWGYTLGGLGAGLLGAVVGTLAGYEARIRLSADGHGLPVALLEDTVAVLGGVAIAVLTASV